MRGLIRSLIGVVCLSSADVIAGARIRCGSGPLVGALLLAVTGGGSAAAADQEAAPSGESVAPVPAVDFHRDIKPILERNCFECHASDDPSSGLRLDRKADARAGGFTGLPVLGGTLETNELYRRVSSTDRSVWMPKGKDRLSEQEISLIRRWVETGTPWPERIEVSAFLEPASEDPWTNDIVFYLQDVAKSLSKWRDLLLSMAGLLFLLAMAEKLKQWHAAGHPMTKGRARLLFIPFSKWRASFHVIAVLAVLFGNYALMQRARVELLSKEIYGLEVKLKQRDEKLAKMGAERSPGTGFGDPPRPIRAGYPKRISSTYYRGNCERDSVLFNNGNYRTATFHLGLCDSNRRPLKLGDRVASGEISIRFEIERAPKATTGLFSEAIMDSVFLTDRVPGSGSQGSAAEAADHHPNEWTATSLESLEATNRWVAYYPIGTPATTGSDTLSGIVYVVRAPGNQNLARSVPQYGIEYDLKVEEGRLVEGSDLWMGDLYRPQAIAPPFRDKIPADEWFDFRPIPTITGENSDDPQLLGIDAQLPPSPEDK